MTEQPKLRQPQAIVRDVHRQLRAMGKPARRELAKSYFPTTMTVFGVTVTDLRGVVRDLTVELKPAEPDHVIEVAQAIVDAGGFESRQVAYEIIKRHKSAPGTLDLKQIESLGHAIDNWASVDSFACDVSGPAWREQRIRDTAVHRWGRSENYWWRRTALVSTIALNMKSRGGRGDVPRTIEICERLADDREEMVAKALSWALRALLAVDASAVDAFLERHEDSLAKRVLREVRNKMSTGLKTPKNRTPK